MSNNRSTKIAVFVVIFTAINASSLVSAAQGKFTLITFLYNETVPARAKEYIACMERNLNHPAIGTIHVFYDTFNNDGGNNQILNYLKSKNVTIEYSIGRPTFGQIFELANRCYPNSRIIISNADIYFNKTLHDLDGYDLTNKFLALTRWNCTNGGRLRLFGSYLMFNPHRRRPGIVHNGAVQAHDAWIFSTPLGKFQNEDIPLGTMGCDVLMAYQVQLSSMELLNPCLTVQCCHLHLSGHRNYDKDVRPPMPPDYKSLGYCALWG